MGASENAAKYDTCSRYLARATAWADADFRLTRLQGCAAAAKQYLISCRVTEPVMRHDFLNKLVPDDGSDHLWHGYPDECFAFSSFADSLVALILYDAWGVQPPITGVRKAIIVDFVSERQSQAETSLGHGWNGAWEFPMGVSSTVHSRVETNEQNAKIGRHLSLIGTAMTNEDFFRAVGEKLLDVHSCHDKSCKICGTRTRRALTDVFQILATGTKQSEVHLFANWTPGDDLIEPLRSDGITIASRPLVAIPRRAIEANRYYNIWDGTEQQAHEFREAFWAPAWMKPLDMPLGASYDRSPN